MIQQLQPMEVRTYGVWRRIGVIQDGSSLFHVISTALSEEYRLGDKKAHVEALKVFIVKALKSRIDRLDPNSPTLYSTLQSSLTLSDMVEQLLSGNIDIEDYIIVISRVINVSIICYSGDDIIRYNEDYSREVNILRLANGNYELLLV